MRNYKAKDVDEYIANAPIKVREKLKELRRVIKLAEPKAEEEISWGIPFYKYHGILAGFAAFGDHVSFGFADAIQNNYREILEKIGYIIGKKTIQIKFDQNVPTMEIRQILKAKAKMNTKAKSKIR